jgi:hypothetical protein
MKKLLTRLATTALATTVVALAAATPAVAQRGCDAANPLMLCPLAECIALQADVTLRCKTPAPSSCSGITGCSALRAMKQRWLDCAAARSRINARCWAGGDPGHQQQVAQAYQNVATCDARIALPRPVGCADPCSATSSVVDLEFLELLRIEVAMEGVPLELLPWTVNALAPLPVEPGCS